jgi:hypothetical protein
MAFREWWTGAQWGPYYYYVFEATDGGRGSFSHADPSKHGQREIAQNILGSQVPMPIDPGDGGGARPLPLSKYGAAMAGYSPNGVVIVKVFKLE